MCLNAEVVGNNLLLDELIFTEYGLCGASVENLG